MSQQNVQAARGLYDAFNRGDLAAFEQACASELVWNEAENSINAAGNPYRSFGQVVEGVFEPTMRDFDQFRCELERLIDGGDYVIGTGRYRGRHRGTGKQLSAQFCHISHFDGSARLDSIQEYTDTLHEAQVDGRVETIPEMRIPNPVM
jgi:uncharacterized protein